MVRARQRQVLEAFSKDFNREMHNLKERPDILWQQMYNRLQWVGGSERDDLTSQIIGSEYKRRIAIGAKPWLHMMNRLQESEALIRIFQGHRREVNSCAFFPDGKRILSAGWDATLKVWDVYTGKEILTLSGHEHSVNCCDISRDGRLIISASSDNTLKLWDANTGKELKGLIGHSNKVNACTFSPDGRLVASASRDHTIKLWDVETGSELASFEGEIGCESCDFSPDGKTLASVGFLHFKLWNVETHEEIIKPGGFIGNSGRREITDTGAFSPKEQLIVTGTDNETLKLWDLTSGRELTTLDRHSQHVTSCAFSKDGRYIVSGSADKTLKVWDADTGAELAALIGHKHTVNDCAFSPDAKQIISAGNDNTLMLWDVEIALNEKKQPKESFPGLINKISACAFSPDGKYLALCSFAKLDIWEVDSVERIANFHFGHNNSISDCMFLPDSKQIAATTSTDINICNITSGDEIVTLPVHEKGAGSTITSCDVSPDGKYIATASKDSNIRIWNIKKKREVLVLSGHTNWITSCAFSPNSKFIASSSRDNTVKVWDMKKRRELATFSSQIGWFESCSFSPDGELVASGGMGLHLWELATGEAEKLLDEYKHGMKKGKVNSCVFSPNGELLVSAGDDRILRVWNIMSIKESAEFITSGYILCCSFRPFKNQICCGTAYGEVYILNLIGIDGCNSNQ